MGSNRIRGITVEIDGNTTPLSNSLKSVDKSLKDTQSQLNDVNKLLKMDPTNVDLLRQREELLGKAIEDTKERQEQLKNALEQAKTAGSTEEAQRQQNALQRELIETTQKLEALQGQTKKTSSSLSEISAKTGEMAEKTSGLSRAAASVGKAMLGMAASSGETADELLTTARNTGFTVEELQKLQYAADRVDVSYDTMVGSVTKLTKSMASGNKAFDALGVSITNSDGSMRNATDVWYEALEALSQIENETERDAMSMELFGRSAMDMSGIVDDGGAKLRTLGDEAEEAGLIMSTDAVNGAGEFNDALDELRAKAGQAFAKAGGSLATTLIPALEKLVDIVSTVLSWFSNLDGTTQTLILAIVGLAAAISPILGLISTLTGLAGALNVAMLPMIGTIGLIVAAVAAVIAIGVALYKNWDTIKAKAVQLWENIKATFEKIKTAITTPIEKAKEVIKGIIEKIKNFFTFKVELPKIKLPHFAITPKGWKLGDLLKGSIPKLGIEWYAKAMDNGMILDSPTIFGTQNGRLLAGGEAGSEVVVGTNSLMNMIRSATAGAGGVSVNVVINGNVDDYDELAETIGQKLQQQMAREGRAFA